MDPKDVRQLGVVVVLNGITTLGALFTFVAVVRWGDSGISQAVVAGVAVSVFTLALGTTGMLAKVLWRVSRRSRIVERASTVADA